MYSFVSRKLKFAIFLQEAVRIDLNHYKIVAKDKQYKQQIWLAGWQPFGSDSGLFESPPGIIILVHRLKLKYMYMTNERLL